VFLHDGAAGEIVKVVDFGIAKLLDDAAPDPDLTQLGTLIGTPTYMAPERLLGGAYDARSDIYSVGVMLYTSVSGEMPFGVAAPSVPEMVKLHLTAKPTPLREVPERFADLVMRTLSPDAAARPGLREVAGELRRV
jgi:serine/threonine protein kinase